MTAPALSPWGWDNGLTQQVVASPFQDEANYFSEPANLNWSDPHWTIAVESEGQAGRSSPGPACQSFPIHDITQDPVNTPGPILLRWSPYTNTNGVNAWSINLETDFYDNPDPSGVGYFTWYAFGLNVDQSGGILPPPDTAAFDVNLLYSDWLPAAGARVSVDWQGWWNGQAYDVEIDLYRSSDAWGAPSQGLVQNIRDSSTLDFVELNGAALGLTLTPGVLTHVHIDWGSLVQRLVTQGILPAPNGGWGNAVTQDFYIATEFWNGTQANAGIADLWGSDFSVSEDDGNPQQSSTMPIAATPENGGSGMTTVTPPVWDNVTIFADGTQVVDSNTGAIVQTLPASASDRMQFLSVGAKQYGTNLLSAASSGLDPAALRDFGGNNVGDQEDWQMLGLASVRQGASPSYILVNPQNGRWAEVAVQADGSFNFNNFGANGDTRVVGIYEDPLVQQGIVAAGGPDDSQARLLSDISADRLAVLGSLPDPDELGFEDLFFKLTNHSADHTNDVYLRAILWPDGNIQYANYMNSAQFQNLMTQENVPTNVYSKWMTSI